MSNERERNIGLVMQGGTQWMGGAQYVVNWARVLARRSTATVRLSVVCETDEQKKLAAQAGPGVAIIFGERGRSLAQRLVDRASFELFGGRPSMDHRLQRQNFDYVFPFFPGMHAHVSYAYSAWIPDFQHLKLPAFFGARECAQRTRLFRRIGKHAPSVVVSSKSSLQDLLEFEPSCAHRATVLRFHTVTQASWFDSDPASVRGIYKLPERFFIVCNQFWRHKNHTLILKALARLRNANMHVVATGTLTDYRAPGYAEEIRATIRGLGIDKQVHLLGLIPRDHQIQLMRQSLAVIQPSRFEGWSTVVEDARALGKHVIASNLAVHREQLVGCSDFFGTDDEHALAELMSARFRELDPGPQLERERAAQTWSDQALDRMAGEFLALAARSVEG